MAGKAGRVAHIVSSVMGYVDVRKPNRPDHEDPEESGEYRRGESIGSGKGPRPGRRSGADDLRLHDRIRGWDDFEYRLPDAAGPPPEPELPGGLLTGRETH
jgi:hypothetical protein